MKARHHPCVALWAQEEDMTTVEAELAQLRCKVARTRDFDRLWNLLEEVDLVVVRCTEAPDILFWMNGVRRAGGTTPPVLLLATSLDIDQYLKAMSLGAFDCIGLPVRPTELQRVINRAVEEAQRQPLLLVS